MNEVKCIAKGQYALAESPMWNKWRSSLLYIDIADKKVYEYKTKENTINSIEFDGMVGTVALIDENTILVANENKLIKTNLDTYEQETIMTFDMEPELRFNDGKCDDKGRFWLGTLTIDKDINKRFEKGSLYSVDNKGEIKVHKENLTIANGMAWNMSKNTMYFTDSYTKRVDTYDYNSEKGLITYKESKINISKGQPDGLTIDEEGMLWIALWGGYSVIRVNPTTGEILSTIELPDKNVTCCIFGGENLDTLYITTASDDEGNRGSLYSVKTNTRGYETNLSSIK